MVQNIYAFGTQLYQLLIGLCALCFMFKLVVQDSPGSHGKAQHVAHGQQDVVTLYALHFHAQGFGLVPVLHKKGAQGFLRQSMLRQGNAWVW